MLLSELLSADRVRVPLGGRTKDDLLRELVELAVPSANGDARAAVLATVHEREREVSTGIGAGVAIPHGKTTQVDALVMAAGTAPVPVDFDALDGQPVELLFMLVGPESSPGAHVQALAGISRLLRRETLRNELRAARTPGEFLDVVRALEAA